MSLYYFNVHDGQDFLDDQGTDFPDLAAAQSGAVVLAADLLKDAAKTFWDGEDWSMDVSDGDGLILFTLRFTGNMAPACNWEARPGRRSATGRNSALGQSHRGR